MVFITGVSKFSRVSIFSDLNNLNDITLNPRYASMLGYTQEELEASFEEHIEALCKRMNRSRKEVLKKIADRYNGYSWDGESFVYNPFSILLLFNHLRFSNYWFSTATPTFLVNLVKEKEYYDFDEMVVGEAFFDSFQIERDIPLATLLFQTGYLTIKKYDPWSQLYTLGYPNREVKESMLEYLLSAFSDFEPGFGTNRALRARQALRQGNVDELVEVLNGLLQNLPYHLHEKTERFYHIVIHLFFDYIGLEVQSEVNTARGRADAVVELEDKIYCFEFKLDDSAHHALEQILERGYLDKYRDKGKRRIAVGINFSTQKRAIDGVELREV